MGEEQVLGDNRIVGDLSEGFRAWSVSVLGHAFEGAWSVSVLGHAFVGAWSVSVLGHAFEGAVWYDMVDVELVGCDTEVTSQVA